jgi:hypothetical protein
MEADQLTVLTRDSHPHTWRQSSHNSGQLRVRVVHEHTIVFQSSDLHWFEFSQIPTRFADLVDEVVKFVDLGLLE